MGILRKLYRPELFQGSLRKRGYFEGWYLKHVSADLQNVLAFIPGISLSAEPHAFIQVINGISGKTLYFSYELDSFSWDRRSFTVRIGNSVFSDRFSSIDISQDNHEINGMLEYSGITPYPKTVFSPGIMGWYSFVPFMECNHGVVSMHHSIEGELVIDSSTVDFTGGTGYIEKDWGTSFPQSWIWLQCNTFEGKPASLMLSIAKIPWVRKFFIGFISFLNVDGKLYSFSTYNGSDIDSVQWDSTGELRVGLSNREHHLEITVFSESFGSLKAPRLGTMERFIRESLDSRVSVKLYNRRGTVLFSGEGTRAGFEIIPELLEYFSPDGNYPGKRRAPGWKNTKGQP